MAFLSCLDAFTNGRCAPELGLSVPESVPVSVAMAHPSDSIASVVSVSDGTVR